MSSGDDGGGSGGGSLSVALFFVDSLMPVESQYQACGATSTAGPFMSAGSATEWRNVFSPDATISSAWSTDDGVCNDQPLQKRGDAWVRGG